MERVTPIACVAMTLLGANIDQIQRFHSKLTLRESVRIGFFPAQK